MKQGKNKSSTKSRNRKVSMYKIENFPNSNSPLLTQFGVSKSLLAQDACLCE